MQYIDRLKACGIPAELDVYHTDMHAFDILAPDEELSRQAAGKFNEKFRFAQENYYK